MCVVPSGNVVHIFDHIFLVVLVNRLLSVRGLDMCPRRPVKPPQVLVEGVLVVWGTRIDRLIVPGLPQLDVRVVCHPPILGLVPLPAVIPTTKRLLVVPYTPLNYSFVIN